MGGILRVIDAIAHHIRLTVLKKVVPLAGGLEWPAEKRQELGKIEAERHKGVFKLAQWRGNVSRRTSLKGNGQCWNNLWAHSCARVWSWA